MMTIDDDPSLVCFCYDYFSCITFEAPYFHLYQVHELSVVYRER